MRVFLSKFLLTIFIAIFAVPSSLLASPGNNWTPPVGGPTVGTNVPAPVNIGNNSQRKEGGLTIGRDLKVDFGSILSGGTFFDNDTDMGGGDFMASFVPATFLNQVNVGQDTAGVELNLFGRLKYKPTNANGSDVQGGQPGPGRVLKATDTLGNMVWGDALPGATNNGDTLIWSVACNCWTTGPVTNTGGGATLPPGTPGQTLWFDDVTNSWQATNKIEHYGAGMDTIRTNTQYTTLNSRVVGIGTSTPASSETTVNSNLFNVRGFNTINLGSGGTVGGTLMPSQRTNLRSQNVIFRPDETASQNLDINSDTVDFGFTPPNGYVPQAVTFNSSSVKFKGPAQNPALLDAGIGRIPMSVDADGTFKWNKYLTYGNIPFAPGLNLGQLNLANPDNGIAVFSNAGITWLGSDTVISEGGDLYLEGLEGGQYSQWAAGEIKHLCYLEGTKKVVTCPATTLPVDSVPGVGVVTPVGGVAGDDYVMFTPDDNGSQYTFNFSGTVTVKYCGGGGGGGGGGIGEAEDPDEGSGLGGAGGGGGSKGQCHTEDLDVNSGDILTWDIGEGGSGGSRAYYGVSFPGNVAGPSSAVNGQMGLSTSIFFDPVGSPASSQIGTTAAGGFGGISGRSAYQGTMGSDHPWSVTLLPGANGDPNLPRSSFLSPPGGANYPQGKFHGLPGNTSDNSFCPSCGGNGGWGESLDNQGTLIEGLNSAEPSARGAGGGFVPPTIFSQSGSIRVGGNGKNGNFSFGGGGGGGSSGALSNTLNFTIGPLGAPGPDVYQILGGNGGMGGDGYVYIYGLPESTSNPGEIVYSTPGTFSLTAFEENNTIPADVQNFTVEVWGAGGGAGGVLVNSGGAVRRGGGGGTGGYRTMTMTRANLFNAEFIVGAKGVNGTNAASTPTSGQNGAISQVRPIGGGGGFTALGADGGAGGTPWINAGGNEGQGGAGGDQFPNGYPSGVTVGASGVDGTTNTGPCNLAGETVTSNNGFGAGSPRTCTDSTLNIYQGSAQNGRIRISW